MVTGENITDEQIRELMLAASRSYLDASHWVFVLCNIALRKPDPAALPVTSRNTEDARARCAEIIGARRMLLAETVTDEQIRDLLDEPGVSLETEDACLAALGRGHHGPYRDAAAARSRCADILNARKVQP